MATIILKHFCGYLQFLLSLKLGILFFIFFKETEVLVFNLNTSKFINSIHSFLTMSLVPSSDDC